jgi:hypothetical protein
MVYTSMYLEHTARVNASAAARAFRKEEGKPLWQHHSALRAAPIGNCKEEVCDDHDQYQPGLQSAVLWDCEEDDCYGNKAQSLGTELPSPYTPEMAFIVLHKSPCRRT